MRINGKWEERRIKGGKEIKGKEKEEGNRRMTWTSSQKENEEREDKWRKSRRSEKRKKKREERRKIRKGRERGTNGKGRDEPPKWIEEEEGEQ